MARELAVLTFKSAERDTRLRWSLNKRMEQYKKRTQRAKKRVSSSVVINPWLFWPNMEKRK